MYLFIPELNINTEILSFKGDNFNAPKSRDISVEMNIKFTISLYEKLFESFSRNLNFNTGKYVTNNKIKDLYFINGDKVYHFFNTIIKSISNPIQYDEEYDDIIAVCIYSDYFNYSDDNREVQILLRYNKIQKILDKIEKG